MRTQVGKHKTLTPYCVVWMSLAIGVWLLVGIANAQTLVTYPAPQGSSASHYYTLTVNGDLVYVYDANEAASRWNTHFGHFSTSGPVTITVIGSGL